MENNSPCQLYNRELGFPSIEMCVVVLPLIAECLSLSLSEHLSPFIKVITSKQRVKYKLVKLYVLNMSSFLV